MHDLKTAVATRRQLSNAAGVVQIPPNASRIAVILSSPATVTTILQMGAQDDNLTGVPIAAGAAPTKLLRDELGSAIQEAITLINAAGTQVTFTWIEITLAP